MKLLARFDGHRARWQDGVWVCEDAPTQRLLRALDAVDHKPIVGDFAMLAYRLAARYFGDRAELVHHTPPPPLPDEPGTVY